MISSGINLVMTVIGFGVSTMFIVFVCTRLVCARIHLNASRRSFPVAYRSDLERGLHGLERVVMAKFPTKKYNDEFFLASENAQCTVCLAEFHGEDTLRILPHCGHFFHVSCIDIWLQQHSTCPVCRISLPNNGFPPRTHDNHGMNPIQEDHCMPEGNRAEAGENISPLSEEMRSQKTQGTKHVESPSNP